MTREEMQARVERAMARYEEASQRRPRRGKTWGKAKKTNRIGGVGQISRNRRLVKPRWFSFAELNLCLIIGEI